MIIRVAFNVTIQDFIAATIIILDAGGKVNKITLMDTIRELYHGHAGLHYGIDYSVGLTKGSIENHIDEALEILKKYYDFETKKERAGFLNLLESTDTF